MSEDAPRRRFDLGELLGGMFVAVVFLVVLAITAGGLYVTDFGTGTRWVLCGVGAGLVAVGVPLSRTCILGVMGVMMLRIGAGFVIGNVAAFVFPRVA